MFFSCLVQGQHCAIIYSGITNGSKSAPKNDFSFSKTRFKPFKAGFWLFIAMGDAYRKIYNYTIVIKNKRSIGIRRTFENTGI